MKSAVSKIFLVAAIVSGATALAACSSAPGAENTGTAEGEMRCRPGTTCDPANQPTCDPSSTCCYGGGQSMSEGCAGILYGAGCRSTSGTGKAHAVEMDGYGHWWFEVYCPTSAAWVASDPTCQSQGIAWNYPGNTCTISSPPAGKVDVIYDPNCPSGCAILAN